MLIVKYRVMTHTSHINGDLNCECRSRFSTRSGLPISIMMKSPATIIHTVERIVAGFATTLNAGILNTVADDETIRPPADRPTKNINIVIYNPQETALFIPVTPRP